MPLASDQQAMLQLLLERGQSYGDLAGVLGVDASEVRERSRRALAELGGADPDRRVGLTDYLLGQADPIGRADAVRHLKQDAEDRRLAEELSQRLREVAPNAELPTLPAQSRGRGRARAGGLLPRRGARASTPAGERGAREPRQDRRRPWRRLPAAPSLSRRGSLLAIAGAAAAAILVVVVLAVTGAFGGDDDGDETASTTPTTPIDEPTTIPLEPQGGGNAKGDAVLGYASADQPYLDLSVRGAPPARGNDVYILWFLLDERTGFPIPAQLPIDGKGNFSNTLGLPPGVLPFIDEARFLDLSLVDAKKLNEEITAALEDRQGAVPYLGRSVLRGEVPGSPDAG